MTYEAKAKWIRRVFLFCLGAIIIAVIFAPGRQGDSGRKQVAESPAAESPKANETRVIQFNETGGPKDGEITGLLEEASRKRGSQVLGIIHCHEPGNPESEQIADSLNMVARKYGTQVLVVRVNIVACPAYATMEQVRKAPEVIMRVGAVRAFRFQGLWSRPQIELKVDELIHGLQRMGKNWMPEVRGMQPAGKR